jgi:preprotein translocase subunit SecG
VGSPLYKGESMQHIAHPMSIIISLLTVILMIVCLLIVAIVLMQRPRQEGLGAAFGGGMTDQMFGAQTTNVLQKGTVYLAVSFFGISLLLAILMSKQQGQGKAVPDALTESDPVPVQEAPSTGLTIDAPPMVPGEPGEVPEGGLTIETPSLVPGEPSDGAGAAMPLGEGKDLEESGPGASDKKEAPGKGAKGEEASADAKEAGDSSKPKKNEKEADAPKKEAGGEAEEAAAEGEATN